jgi:Family of unknown function (DUF5681)
MRNDGMPVGTPFGADNPPPGRPKGSRNVKTILRELIEITETVRNPITGEDREASQLEIMLAKLVVMAKHGDLASIDRVLDRLEGRPEQKTKNENKNTNLNTNADLADVSDDKIVAARSLLFGKESSGS